MSELFEPTLAEMIAEAERELAVRRRVYPRWVEQGKMKQHQAERQIEMMAAIAEFLRRAVA